MTIPNGAEVESLKSDACSPASADKVDVASLSIEEGARGMARLVSANFRPQQRALRPDVVPTTSRAGLNAPARGHASPDQQMSSPSSHLLPQQNGLIRVNDDAGASMPSKVGAEAAVFYAAVRFAEARGWRLKYGTSEGCQESRIGPCTWGQS